MKPTFTKVYGTQRDPRREEIRNRPKPIGWDMAEAGSYSCVITSTTQPQIIHSHTWEATLPAEDFARLCQGTWAPVPAGGIRAQLQACAPVTDDESPIELTQLFQHLYSIQRQLEREGTANEIHYLVGSPQEADELERQLIAMSIRYTRENQELPAQQPVTKESIARVFDEGQPKDRKENLRRHAVALRDRMIDQGKSPDQVDAWLRSMKFID